MGWAFLASMEASGGVLLMWDKRVVECIGNFSIASFKNVVDGWEQAAYVGACGPNSYREMRILWEELVRLYYRWDVPWCMSGGINVTRFPSDRSGDLVFIRQWRIFQS